MLGSTGKNKGHIMTIRQYYKDADAGFDSTIDVGVILTIRWVAIIGQGAALLFTHLFLQLDFAIIASAVCD